jgi:UDP-N-acetyl-D-mannosaminuronic acid dehydrogenase
MTLDELRSKVESRRARLAVIGLGYVGFPVACEFARVGFNVLGVEKQVERVSHINAGLSPIKGNEPGLQELAAEVIASGRLVATNDTRLLADCDVVLVCVETPVSEDHTPNYRALRSAVRELGRVMKPGALVIVESTVSPGTMREVVLPTLERSSGMRLNEGFYLGICPERVMPGKLLTNIRGVSRVVGGMTQGTAEVMRALYRHVVDADLDVSDCITAELVKTVENTYRDVQIAFANEVAIICEKVGGDVWAVRELVNKSPGRMMLMPGAGVGGHCIPKDPWLLASSVRGEDVPIQVIPAARSINSKMPQHVGELLRSALENAGVQMAGAKVLILGYAYLEDSDDTRNSPSIDLEKYLVAKGAQVSIHDPYVRRFHGAVLERAMDCDAAVVMVKHSLYRSLDLKALRGVMRGSILVDGRAVFSQDQAREAGFAYIGVGVSPASRITSEQAGR